MKRWSVFILSLIMIGVVVAADFNKPTTSDNWATWSAQIIGHAADNARLLDPAYTSPTNVPTNAYRFNSASGAVLQRWNGSTWTTIPCGTAMGCWGTNQATARDLLDLVPGTDVQAYDSDLLALAGLGTTGLVVRTGTGAFSTRTLTCGTGLTCSNGDGVSAAPSVTPSTNLQAWSAITPPAGTIADLTSSQSFSNKTYAGGAVSGTFTGAATWSGNQTYSGSIIHTKACAAGYTRVGPGVCVAWPQTSTTTLTRDSCTSFSFPSGATAIGIEARVFARAAFSAGNLRTTDVTVYSDTSCSTSASSVVTTAGLEFTAQGSGILLSVSDGFTLIPVNSNYRIRMSDDTGNQGSAVFRIAYYLDM